MSYAHNEYVEKEIEEIHNIALRQVVLRWWVGACQVNSQTLWQVYCLL